MGPGRSTGWREDSDGSGQVVPHPGSVCGQPYAHPTLPQGGASRHLEEVIEEEFPLPTGTLEDHEHDAARGFPAPGPVAALVDPGASFPGRAARRPFQVRPGEAGAHPKPDLEVVPVQLLEHRQPEPPLLQLQQGPPAEIPGAPTLAGAGRRTEDASARA